MTPLSNDSSGFSFTPRLVLGLGIAVFGVILLFDRLDLIDARFTLRFWPLILVVIGVLQYLNPASSDRAGRSRPISAIVWMALGGILLLNSFDILRVSIWELFWPALLIALGVRLMARPRLRVPGDAAWTGSAAAAPSGDIGAVFAVLGGVRRVSARQPFPGAEVTTFMGGAHLDLRQAILQPGSEAVLDIFAVMGGCELMVPPNWVVSAPIVAIMGGVDDKRVMVASSVIDEATSRTGQPPRLVIRGFVMMGGVTIRS